jgi:DNA-binding transcriptional MocR family regulator
MPKRTTTFELMLPPRDPGAPAYRWLYAALRAEILAGRLRPGARLPGTRDLARQYGLSRGTIVNAFEQLRSEGYLSARQRLAGWLEISTIEAGLHTVGWLRGGVSEEAATQAAAQRDVEVAPLSVHSRGRLERAGLALGFAAVDAAEIRRGVRELAAALEFITEPSATGRRSRNRR